MENIKELLNNDGKMIETANELFNYRQADNTAAGYVTTINKFREFCTERKGLNFDKFGEKELAGFIVHMARVMPNSKYVYVWVDQTSHFQVGGGKGYKTGGISFHTYSDSPVAGSEKESNRERAGGEEDGHIAKGGPGEGLEGVHLAILETPDGYRFTYF